MSQISGGDCRTAAADLFYRLKEAILDIFWYAAMLDGEAERPYETLLLRTRYVHWSYV
jgi:hypothetical protein